MFPVVGADITVQLAVGVVHSNASPPNSSNESMLDGLLTPTAVIADTRYSYNIPPVRPVFVYAVKVVCEFAIITFHPAPASFLST